MWTPIASCKVKVDDARPLHPRGLESPERALVCALQSSVDLSVSGPRSQVLQQLGNLDATRRFVLLDQLLRYQVTGPATLRHGPPRVRGIDELL